MDNLRRIILTFTALVLAALTVTGIALAFQSTSEKRTNEISIKPESEKYDGKGDSENEPDPVQNKEPARTLLVIKGEFSENLYFIADVDRDAGALSLTFLPAETKISIKVNGEPEYLALPELQAKGMEFLTDAVAGKFGIRLSRYLVTDRVGLGTFINYFCSRDNGVLFSLPVGFTVISDGLILSYVKGKDFFDGFKGSTLVNFSATYNGVFNRELLKYYDGSDMCHVKMAASFMNDFVSQKLVGDIDEYYKDNYSTFIKMFIEQHAQTNITANDAETVAAELLSVKEGAVKTYVLDENNGSLFGISMGEEDFIIENYDEGSKKEFLESLY